ncbi:GlcNac transferase, partial [Thraustotheca clavata]
ADWQAHLRPPSPRISNHPDIFIGIAAYRDGFKCGFTLWTAFSRAKKPERVFFGIVDQTIPGDLICLEEYCRRAKETWPNEECKYKENIKIDPRDAMKSKGPIIARYQQQQLIGNQEFCMELDAHSQFLNDWDVEIIKEWARTDNEMAVLSNYPLPYSYISEGGKIPTHYSSHLASYLKRGHEWDIPVIGGYLLIDDSEHPQMSSLWGGCLSFSKCHAEKRAPMDKYMNWIFWGEEYLRSMQLWTHGYDIYSPSRHGVVVFHNWTNDPKKHRFWDNDTMFAEKPREEAKAYNRLRVVLTLPFQGEVDTRELHKYGPGRVRSIGQFLNFSGISNSNSSYDVWPTEQRRWVPYSVPDEVEELLPGWKLHDVKKSVNEEVKAVPVSTADVVIRNELQQLRATLDAESKKHATNAEKLLTKLEVDRAGNEKMLQQLRLEIAKLRSAESSNPAFTIMPALALIISRTSMASSSSDGVKKAISRRRINSTMITKEQAKETWVDQIAHYIPCLDRVRLQLRRLLSSSVQHHSTVNTSIPSFISPLQLNPHLIDIKFSDAVVTFSAAEANYSGAASIRGIRNYNEDTYRIITNLEKYRAGLVVAHPDKAQSPTELVNFFAKSSIFDSEDVLKEKYADWFIPTEIPKDSKDECTQFYGVYDGHAGRRCSAIIARALPLCLLACDNEFQKDLTQCLKTGCLDLDKQFLDLAAAQGLKDGSTAITVVIRNNKVYVANIGDCRAIMVSFEPITMVSKVRALSTDQKPHSPSEKCRIEAAGGIVLNIHGINRVNGLLAVARAFGDLGLKRYIIAEPDVTVHCLQENDAFIVIATDGLWDVFSNEAVGCFVKAYLGMPLDSLALKLTKMAVELGSTDNITAIVVNVRRIKGVDC